MRDVVYNVICIYIMTLRVCTILPRCYGVFDVILYYICESNFLVANQLTSYHILSYLIISYLILSNLILSYLFLSFLFLSYLILSILLTRHA